MIDQAFLSIAELGARYRDGSLTPLAVTEAALARIDRLEPKLNAFADRMADAALADATRRTAEIAAGNVVGPLHGIPVAIKDIIDVAGVPTGYGTRARPPDRPTTDAPLVARLRAAGAVILGKTNLLEYAYGIAHPAIGQTNNPHNPARTSGGSSGGSAAAVAAGIVPLAIGTDTGGSIRGPASYCGVVGLKPTFGLVPTEGVFPLSWTLDHAGPIARSVADAALGLAVLSGTAVPLSPLPIKGLRVGRIMRHFGSREVTPGVREALEAAMERLRAAGAVIIDIDIPEIAGANHALMTIVQPEASLIHEALLPQNPEGYAPLTRAQIEAGRAVPVIEYVRAMRQCSVIRSAVEAAFATVDVLASPTIPFVAPESDPQIEDGDGELLSCGVANVTGHPAISLNADVSEGLPVGVQLIGRHGHDAGLLATAAAIELVLEAAPRPQL
jgi:aspartyl-tRNA(Asn)/glutamyl-tRNA(Gln) amidotransferase subunit A